MQGLLCKTCFDNKEIDFDKVSLVYQNELLFDNYMPEERDDGYWFERESRSEVFPLWYFYGEKFIEKEIDKLSSETDNVISKFKVSDNEIFGVP